jgi:hypothetical protein
VNLFGYILSYTLPILASGKRLGIKGDSLLQNRLLIERAVPQDGEERRSRADNSSPKRRARSVTVNLAEAPLGWLKARGLISERQFLAGERLREDWERAQLGPSVTMKWDAAPLSKTALAAPAGLDPTHAQLSAKDRFDKAIASVGPGLTDVLWRIVCAGEGMRDAERALGWPARAGKLVLGFALERLADYYRIG